MAVRFVFFTCKKKFTQNLQVYLKIHIKLQTTSSNHSLVFAILLEVTHRFHETAVL